MEIPFSPPDIRPEDIDAVCDALRSGWITTGPRTKRFEKELAEYCDAAGVACLASATASLECALRLFGIGPGDEVITTAYTYTASCSVICHVGATPVLVDVAPDSYQMDLDALDAAITKRTKAIIPVDIAGIMCDYDAIFALVESKRDMFVPQGEMQQALGRLAIVADGAHSLGASYHGHMSGSVADFTAFSFHAVKNLTTGEGGALAWREHAGIDSNETYQKLMLMSLHGQSKDALHKNRPGAWEYDVAWPAYKCNMTDISAALGLSQLHRYPELLARRREILDAYEAGIPSSRASFVVHDAPDTTSSRHLCLVRLPGKGRSFRDALIEHMAILGVSTNVHYKPLPMLTAYSNLGFDIADFPNAYAQFVNEITLPLYTKLTDEQVCLVIETFERAWDECEADGVI